MNGIRRSHGFTLIELLIVIIIIGILAAIAIPMFLDQKEKAKTASLQEAMHQIAIGIKSYAADTNDSSYPPEGAPGLKGLLFPGQMDVWPATRGIPARTSPPTRPVRATSCTLLSPRTSSVSMGTDPGE